MSARSLGWKQLKLENHKTSQKHQTFEETDAIESLLLLMPQCYRCNCGNKSGIFVISTAFAYNFLSTASAAAAVLDFFVVYSCCCYRVYNAFCCCILLVCYLPTADDLSSSAARYRYVMCSADYYYVFVVVVVVVATIAIDLTFTAPRFFVFLAANCLSQLPPWLVAVVVVIVVANSVASLLAAVLIVKPPQLSVMVTKK